MSKNSRNLRLINTGLLLSFAIGYMEWGGENASFVFQVIGVMFQKEGNLLTTLTHPIILIGIIGIVLLLVSIFSKAPNKILNIAGIILPGVVMGFILLAGMLSFNLRMLVSVIPFIAFTLLYFWYQQRKSKQQLK